MGSPCHIGSLVTGGIRDQAKNIRQTSLRLAADNLATIVARPDISTAERARLEALIKRYRSTADRYESDQKGKDGKRQLFARARAQEKLRDYAARQDPYFDYSQALIQIAIVLASVSIVTGSVYMLFFSYGMSLVGMLLLLNAFTLVVRIGFLE
jgi:hypothetical protein